MVIVASHRVLFVGAGRMAQAMIQGIAKKTGDIDWQVFVANRSDVAKRIHLANTYGVHSVEHWEEAVDDADVIILAIPPADHPNVLTSLARRIHKAQLVVSVAAGIGISGLAKTLGSHAAVSWCMPNIAASLGQSMTLVAVGESVTPQQEQWLFDILRGLGEYEVCSEADVHHLTAITGSAPAFVFQMAHVLETLAASYGMSQGQARKLVGQMILGSGHLLMTGQDPLTLSDDVTTPGGSTAAGHAILDTWRWHEALHHAMLAVNRHAQAAGVPSHPTKDA